MGSTRQGLVASGHLKPRNIHNTIFPPKLKSLILVFGEVPSLVYFQGALSLPQ